MRVDRRRAVTALAAAAALPAARAQPTAAAASQAEPARAEIPVEFFFQPDELAEAVPNPAGTHVALLARYPGKQPALIVLDLATMAPRPLAAGGGRVLWVNDQRLLHLTPDGCHAINLDGSQPRALGYQAFGVLAQGPRSGDHVLVARPQDRSEGIGFMKLVRLNTRNGREEELEVPPWSAAFLIDREGEPLAALTAHRDKQQLHWREGGKWRQVQESERYWDQAFVLCGQGPDGTVYVSARRGHDQAALYTYDARTGQLSDKAVLALKGYDLEPGLIADERRLLGLRVRADAVTTVWLDAACEALQARVDALLPATTNLLTPPQRGAAPWVLVHAYADRQPGLGYVFHRETGRLVLLGRRQPQIDPAAMSPMDHTPYAARDGRIIPAYLTLPARAGKRRPLPLVVLVHGGPFVRGASWSWQPEVQFLASRGYAVLQPEFRGSTGFGETHFRAGWKQWGQAMQDDLVDAARWAVAQGVADPKRIAIAGGSYGGYAAMMGLARDPDVFCCALNWVGVTDLDLLYGAYWSDQSSNYKEHGLPRVLGDRKADAARLRENSPLHLAARITKPVLMAYGGRDRRVPIEHGERMRDALKPHNPALEWVVYDGEGHGGWSQATLVDFWSRAQRFLARHMPAA